MKTTRTLTTCAAIAGALALGPALSQPRDARAQGGDGAVVASLDQRLLTRAGGLPRDGFDDVHVPAARDLPYREIVDPRRYVPGTVSFGDTSNGRMLRSSRLPDSSDVHYVLPAHIDRPTHYGTQELIALIYDAGARVQERFPGTRIGVGNMSLADGGDISWSRSHNSGRDADLAFLLHDASGRPVDPTTLTPMRADGRTRAGALYFDVPRNWALVEALVTSDVAHVQWIFIYNPLRTLLLDHARATGADPEVIARAEAVLRQPGDSAPHHDHFHVRVYCSREDRLEGCINIGPRHSFAQLYDDEVELRVRELLRGLMDPDPGIAGACVDFLFRLRPRESATTVALSVPHQSPDVQLRLMDLLEQLGRHGVSGPILPLAESAPDPRVRERAFRLLGALGDPGAAEHLAGMVHRASVTGPGATSATSAATHVSDTGRAAADALRAVTVPHILPTLIDALETSDGELAQRIDRVLRRTTAHRSPVDLTRTRTAEQRVEHTEWWRQWWEEHGQLTRDEWLTRAFNDAGYPLRDAVGHPEQRVLVEALGSDRDELVFNADRLLNLHTGIWTPADGWTDSERERWWRRRLGMRPAPARR